MDLADRELCLSEPVQEPMTKQIQVYKGLKTFLFISPLILLAVYCYILAIYSIYILLYSIYCYIQAINFQLCGLFCPF